MVELGHRCEKEEGGSGNEGSLNEYFPESHFCTTPSGRRNQNVYPEKELLSSAKTKRSRKDKGLNLRKSLAWNPAFFTEEGVLNPSELSKITGLVTKPSSRLPSKTNVESSSKMQFNQFSKRPPLQNLEENFLSKHQARSLSRSSTKKAPKLLPISEASSHDETQMSMALRKSSIKGIAKDVTKLGFACSSLEKGKRKAVHIEKDARTMKSNYCPLSTNRVHMEMNCSASTRMMPSVVEKTHNFYGLPPAPIQAALRMPSPHERVEKVITMKPLFEKGSNLLKLKSCTSSTTNSPMQTTCSGSSGFSQQTFNGSRLPSPLIEAKPSSLRMPSPSIGFFQQKKVISSPSNQLQKTSQVPISGIPSLRRPTKLKHMVLSKPSVAQTEQQSSNGTIPIKTNVYPGKSISSAIFLTTKGSNFTCTDSEACTKNTEIKHIDMKGTISSTVCGGSNYLSDAANDIMSSCLSKKDKKTQDVFLGKPYAARTKELPDEICSISQISSNSLSEGSGMIGSALHSNGFESTSGVIASEVCSTSFEMHFPRILDESNSKQLYVCAPFMNHDLIMHMDAGDKPDATFTDTCKEKISSKLSDSVCNLRTPCICTSEKTSMHIESKELPEEFDAQNCEEHLDKIKFQVQQTILGNTPTIEEYANSSQDVQPVASEKCQLQNNLQLCELRNETSLVKENGFIPAKRISLDILKQGAIPLKHQLSSAPYSEEWLAAIENFGEDILAVKTGKVYNSPPDKAIPEPGPWSPVKRKGQDVGPFDCTKYLKKKTAPSEE